MLSFLWKRYNYVIILFAAILLCGFLYIHQLAVSGDQSRNGPPAPQQSAEFIFNP